MRNCGSRACKFSTSSRDSATAKCWMLSPVGHDGHDGHAPVTLLAPLRPCSLPESVNDRQFDEPTTIHRLASEH